MPSFVTLVEVGPRDGLQNEAQPVSTADKIAFIDRLSASGVPVIEVAAFVSPARVPQMADAADVVRGMTRRAGTRYTALIPNRQGLERAVGAGITEVAITAAASETFSRRNINRSIGSSFSEFAALIADAQVSGTPVRAYLSVSFGCPFEGVIPRERVVELTSRLLEMGAYEVALSDTIGVAHPGQVRAMLDVVLEAVPAGRIALHFHDTRGMAAANVLAALDVGIVTFDASAGGLGGCPFAPGATGNVATEDVLYLLHGLGCDTGVDLDAVARASFPLEGVLGHTLPSRYLRAHHAGKPTDAG